MDDLADKLEMDPVEFRKKNLRDKVYHRQLDRGAREIGWEQTQQDPGRWCRAIEARHWLRGGNVGRRRQ